MADKITSERIEIGSVNGWSHAVVILGCAPDGTWRSGYNFKSRSCCIAAGPSIEHDHPFATRQEAFDHQVAQAMWFFRKRLQDAADGCFSADGVREDTLVILDQIEKRTTPQQLDMFAK